ncbi:hypothetical protein PBY51_013165 [Eleginops maclovinus]|uniref:Proline-rich transmembrane protein 3/4 domain-containing protein n=2 Tax=Eleginops maclovinus TaxID=56733 RepID=A0AAN7XYN1_ELEMC|nr:hypothetical protein PBY51_013165 [Eleginops maclovinus]
MSFSGLHPSLRSPVPQWVPSQRIEKHAKRVTAVCAFFGFLCCSIQMYGLLWLYGLLGNWRYFGWGWWLSQFWARILELAWGFFLLVLGSWIFWTPSRGHHGQGRIEVAKAFEKTSWCSRILARIRRGPLKKSDKTWEDLKPSNWAKYDVSRACFINNLTCPYDDQPSKITPEYNPEPVSKNSSDSQAALLWQKVGECECIISLVEFDIRPLSPINLRRSIDNAIYHRQLIAGLLKLPPSPWTQTMGMDTTEENYGTTIFPPAYSGHGWNLDTESLSASVESIDAKERIQSVGVTTDYNRSVRSAAAAVMHQHDWSEEDVTDL